MENYRKNHFGALDGATVSLKDATAKKTADIKISAITKMLEFIYSKTGGSNLKMLLENTGVLFRKGDGYFWILKGKHITSVKLMGHLIEFIKYVKRV